LIQQVTALGRNLYREAPAVFPIRNFLDPTIDQHDLQIPGERGWVEVQTLPNLNTPNGPNLCHKNQKIQLACFQAEWAEFSIVDASEHTIKFAGARQQAVTRDLINGTVTLIYTFICFHCRHAIILHMQIHYVKRCSIDPYPPPEFSIETVF
jgi:primosomal replication protein N